MNEVEPGQGAAAPTPERAGDRLRAARDAAGLTLAEIAQRTRVPLRHLSAIEESNYAALPSPTYAVGFARAYARAVGLDDAAIAQGVRGELQHVARPPEYEPYETADPARVPSRGLAVIGLGLAVAVLILVGLWYGTDLFRAGDGSGSVTTVAVPAAAPPVAVTPVAAPTPAPPRQVTLTAGENEVWMRVYDADNRTLYLGTLAPGASFDVPPTANRPMINVGRPDQLTVKVDGQAIPPLGDGRRPIKDVPVDAASVAARLTGAPAAAATPPAVASSDTGEAAAPRATAPSGATPRPRPSPTRVLTETQRANIEAARTPAAGGNATDLP